MSPSTDSRENREFAEEIKFVVTRPVGEQIREWARSRLSPDPNASGDFGDQYRITSIYLDTQTYDVYRRNGSYGRSKFRVRKYGESEQVFLERKLKTRGLVTKRRSLVAVNELERLISEQPTSKWAGTWYHRRLLLRKLQPICQIAYDRTARVTMTQHGPIRLTIDENLEAARLNNLKFESSPGIAVSPQKFIIEVKFRSVLPPIFKSLVQEFALTPAPMSKYRLSVVELGLVPASLAA